MGTTHALIIQNNWMLNELYTNLYVMCAFV